MYHFVGVYNNIMINYNIIFVIPMYVLKNLIEILIHSFTINWSNESNLLLN